MRLFFFGPRFMGIRSGVSVGPEDFRSNHATPLAAVRPDTFLYVAKGDEKHCKIGITGNPTERLAQLNTGSPHPLQYAWIGVPRDDGALIEQDAHAMLASYRRNGEWFEIAPDGAVGAINAAAQRRGHPILGCDLAHAEQIRRELIKQATIGGTRWYRRHRIASTLILLVIVWLIGMLAPFDFLTNLLLMAIVAIPGMWFILN